MNHVAYLRSGKWNPFAEMNALQDRLFSVVLGRTPNRGTDQGGESTEWSPLVDVVEDDKEYTINAELPGVTKEDLSVSVENGVLTVSGQRRLENEAKDRKYHRIERAYGRFSRSFTVPEDAEAANVGAEFKDGVLRVRLAKSEHAKPRAVEVKVG